MVSSGGARITTSGERSESSSQARGPAGAQPILSSVAAKPLPDAVKGRPIALLLRTIDVMQTDQPEAVRLGRDYGQHRNLRRAVLHEAERIGESRVG